MGKCHYLESPESEVGQLLLSLQLQLELSNKLTAGGEEGAWLGHISRHVEDEEEKEKKG